MTSPGPYVRTARASRDPVPSVRPAAPGRHGGIVAAIAGGLERKLPGSGLPVSLRRILGRSPLQRHLYHLAEIGVERCVVFLDGQPAERDVEHELRRQLAEVPLGGMRVIFVHDDGPGGIPGSVGRPAEVLLVRSEGVYDPRLYRRILALPSPTWLVDRAREGEGAGEDAVRPIGLAKLDGGSLPDRVAEIRKAHFGAAVGVEACAADPRLVVRDLPAYVPDLRRHLRPYWCVLRTAEDRKRAERMILDAAQKGVLDFPARFLHPAPENLCVRWIASTPVTPNQLTVFTGLVAFAATYLFATQSFGWGLAIALIVNVLDGVDGKLARVKLQASPFGDRLDHLLDVTFELSWYVGLGWGLLQATGHRLPLQLGVGLVGVMLGARAVSGFYKRLTDRQIHDHRPFDRAFRLVAGRRNIYMLVLLVGLAAGHLEEAFYVTFGWGVATLLVYMARTLGALATRSRSLLSSLRP